MRKITIKDIAKKASVSITTVSHAINNTRYVKEETKKRIFKIIDKYGYSVDLNAKSLRNKKTKLIGLIVPDISNVVFAGFIKSFEADLYNNNYSLTICNSNYNKKVEEYYFNILSNRNVDGIVIVPAGIEDDYVKYSKKMITSGKPVIIIKREVKKLLMDTIISDSYKGFYNATNYLIKNNHRDLGYIGKNFSKGSFKGFIDALKDNSIEPNKKFIVNSMGFNYIDGYNAVKEILKNSKKPTAIIAWNDILAIGALKGINDHALRVPDDISIIGSDNIAINEFMPCSLSSITFPKKQIAATAVNIIKKRNNKFNGPPEIIKIPTKLIIRDSVKKMEY